MDDKKRNKMTKISILENENRIKTVPLQGGAISIGRANDNDVLIADNTVSSHHARIFTYFNASYIEDLNSTNGTFINGKRIQKHTLRPGDIVNVGRYRLAVELAD